MVGAQLAARDRAMQTLCMGQGASLGVITGLGLVHYFDWSDTSHIYFPFFSGVLFAVFTYLYSEKKLSLGMSSKSTFFVYAFAVLMATGYLVGSLFPGLETHLSQIYFGDLATMTLKDVELCLFLCVPCLAYLVSYWKVTSNRSFEIAMFGDNFGHQTEKFHSILFQVVAILLLSFSVQIAGLLFTLTCLFLPTGMLALFPKKGLTRHLKSSFLLAAVSSVAGFLISLNWSRFPTVPTIVLTMVGLGLVYRVAVKAT